MDSIGLGFQNCISLNNNIFFPSILGDGLYKFDGKEVKFLGNLGSDNQNIIREYGEMLLYDNKIYIVPHSALELVVYDVAQNSIERKKICVGSEELSSRFYKAFIIDNHLLLFPTRYPGIVDYCLDDQSFVVIDDWIDKVKSCVIFPNDIYFRSGIKILDKLYLPFFNAHAVLEYNINTRDTKIISIGGNAFSSICLGKDDDLWLMPRRGGKILRWNISTDQKTFYDRFPGGHEECLITSVGCISCDDYIWAFPESGKMVLKINALTGDIQEDHLFDSICKAKFENKSSIDCTFTYAGWADDMVLMCSGRTSELFFFYPQEERLEKYFLEVPEDNVSAYKKFLIKRNSVIYKDRNRTMRYEEELFDLSFLISSIAN
jgi:hypothetical protein